DGGGSDFPKAGAADDSARIAKLRVIKRVKKLGAELQQCSIVQSPNPGRLAQRNVRVRLVRAPERSSAEIAVDRAIPDLGQRTRWSGLANVGPVEIPVQPIFDAPARWYLTYCEPRA